MKHIKDFQLFENADERRKQFFTYMGIEFDIKKAGEIIDASPREPLAINPMEWAPQWLSIMKDEAGKEIWDPEEKWDPNKGSRVRSFKWGITFNLGHLKDLKMDEPGILAYIGDMPFLIDGNHRLARNYHEGKDEMPVYVLTPEETESIITNMSPEELQRIVKRSKELR